MALTGEEFDRILDKLEHFMEGVARSYLEKKYEIDTSKWDSDVLLLIVKEVIEREKEEHVRQRKALDDFLSTLPKPKKKEPNTYQINKNEIKSDTYDDDPFSDDDLVVGYSFGEMLDEVIFCDTLWKRNHWSDGVHVRLFEIPDKTRVIVKGSKGFYESYEPEQEDLLGLDWELYEGDVF